MKHLTKTSAALCAFAALALAPSQASAQNKDPVRLVVGFAPGGALDALARGLSEQLAPMLGETVLVDNRPGASSMLSIDFVKRAKPDGRTVLIASGPPFIIFPMSYTSLKYDYKRDFRPVAHLTNNPAIISTSPMSPFRSFQEYVAVAKKDPGQRTFGLTSLGGALHFSIVGLGKEIGVPLTAVNYKGGAPLLTDIAGGHLPVGTDALGSQLELHRAGKVRIIAVGGSERVKWLPDVPTVHELGYKAFDRATTSFGAYVPAGTPDEVVKKLEKALIQATRSAPVTALLERAGIQATGLPAAYLAEQMQKDHDFWKPVVEASGFKVEQ
ncbi:Bug family tripartite tricarboxylate transporter substrate binding protein [Acidovorax sp.]|uniref:Bug family tripartite tricarboxylate transporter substrate binding protein n=1 Tax=Acidovorax sp. TaxID=1872122 RepID=UPI002ACD3ADD|nr:tripartite tricarboxylate transporter substrate-binding protein [Acidovorax sp.]MDZ7862990.1 tripartite tricarboxylate transporter substrate-binding protein [Acidovorax sp.]